MRIWPQLIGHSIATVFEVLLTHAGYYVIPAGVERTNPALRTVDFQTYRRFSKRLQLTPDFFVFDPRRKKNWLVEVKFSQSVRRLDLLTELRRMQREWSYYLILALAEPPTEWKGPARHIRAFYITMETELNLRFLREEGERLQDVFERLSEKRAEGTILEAQNIILRIGKR